MPGLLRRLALIATVAVAFPAGAGAVTATWHTLAGTWDAAGNVFVPRPEAKSLPELEASLREPPASARATQANLSAPDFGWESNDGWWCRAGEVFGVTAIYTIPNPKAIPTGWWGSPQCRSVTIGPEGDHWFTDPGTESIGRVDSKGTVTEYPLPQLPKAAQGYEGDPYPTPGAISAVGSELWVASSSGEGMYSVCVACQPIKATTAMHHHYRRRHRTNPLPQLR